MTDYQLGTGDRMCCVTGRALKPGEACYSVLLQDGAALVRRDYSRDSWSGPPAGAIGYWLGKVPAREQDRRPAIDDEVLLDCFRRLEGQDDPARVNFRYVVALLLMRRRRLKFE